MQEVLRFRKYTGWMIVLNETGLTWITTMKSVKS
jgi:hypothetical protein